MLSMHPHPALLLALIAEFDRERTRPRLARRAKRARAIFDRRAMSGRRRRRDHAPSWPTA
jgi:hypothetical protein